MTTLRDLARTLASDKLSQAEEERCDLCGGPVPAEHRHLVDTAARQLLCACRACTVLFDRPAAGGGHYRLVPERVRAVEDFRLDDERWAAFGIPVGLAFFFHSTRAERVVAFYPSPAGATESLLPLDAWDGLERDNPVLGTLEPDVEALLLRRAEDDALLAPIDQCYALVGLIRGHWRGWGGGDVREHVDAFFDRLRARAELVAPDGKEETWRT